MITLSLGRHSVIFYVGHFLSLFTSHNRHRGAWDHQVCDVINYDTTRFRGVGTALVAHLVHGSWKDGQHPKVRASRCPD